MRIFLFVFFLVIAPLEVFGSEEVICNTPGIVFTRDLSMGMEGEDVRLLQKILNTNPLTQITSSGYGSPGNETSYFGTLTKNAVITFQELYKSEILVPGGLTFGTGYVGSFTRRKLDSFCGVIKNSGGTAMTPTSTQTTPPSLLALPQDVFSYPLHVKYPSTYASKRGQTINIYGGGFTEDSMVHLGDEKIGATLRSDGNLTLILPDDVPYGKHDLWVTNGTKSSNKSFILITRDDAVAPMISSISPQQGVYGEEVTIHGTGFERAENEVITSFGNLEQVSSFDGKTITIDILPDYIGSDTSYREEELDVIIPQWIYVLNKNGISNVMVFNLKM